MVRSVFEDAGLNSAPKHEKAKTQDKQDQNQKQDESIVAAAADAGTFCHVISQSKTPFLFLIKYSRKIKMVNIKLKKYLTFITRKGKHIYLKNLGL